MYATQPVPLIVIDTSAKYGMPMSEQTEVTGRTRRHEKKIDLRIKGQYRIGIMNLIKTSSHSDRPMCQIW